MCYTFAMRHLALLLSLLPVSTLADVKAPGGRVIDCYCTDRNHNRVELGETICLHVDGRMFMAQCQMALNVPMWREVQEGCLSSGLEPAQPALNPIGVYPKI